MMDSAPDLFTIREDQFVLSNPILGGYLTGPELHDELRFDNVGNFRLATAIAARGGVFEHDGFTYQVKLVTSPVLAGCCWEQRWRLAMRHCTPLFYVDDEMEWSVNDGMLFTAAELREHMPPATLPQLDAAIAGNGGFVWDGDHRFRVTRERRARVVARAWKLRAEEAV